MRHAGTDTTFTGNRVVVAVMLVGLAAFVLLGMRGEAQACGGLFCNAPPPDPFAPLPVAQSGENVVFSITQDPAGGAPTLQAHIQILYTGDAAKFSWVVPVDAMPTLSTGSDRLFTALANVTQPRFQQTNQTSGTCISPGVGGTTGTAGAFGGTGSAGSFGAAGAGGGGGVMVSFQGAVGPFDAAVIKSDDSVALLREVWRVLAPNGRLLAVVPNRRGLWARIDTTPFGHGRPFSRGQVTHLSASPLSLMPQGLEEAMSLQEMADLLAYLRGQ
jgi:hypothetical protein